MAYVYNVCHRRDALQIYAVFTRTLIGSYRLFSAFYVQFVQEIAIGGDSDGNETWRYLEMMEQDVGSGNLNIRLNGAG